MPVHLPAGTHLIPAFREAKRYGMVAKGGLVGTGRAPGQTLVLQRDRTSQSKGLIPAKKSQTNPLYVLRVIGSKGVVVEGFALDGGDQGHLYNGIRIEKTTTPRVGELRIVGVPGNSDVPPGETFGLNLWQVTGPVLHDIEIDGARTGASGLGLNSCSGGSSTRLTAHDHPYCKAVALWQHKGGHLFDHVESLNNAFGYGFERCVGTYRLEATKFRGSSRADIHLASDTGRCQLYVNEPDLGDRGRLRVLLSKTELGKPNRQRREDVTLVLGGREQPDLIDFVTRA